MKREPKITPHPGNPQSILEKVYRGMVFSSKDWGQNSFDIALYGIVAGWDFILDNPDCELKNEFKEHGLTEDDCKALEEMHQSFIEIQNKYYR